MKRVSSWEEGEDDARSACPFDILGHTHNTMVITMGCNGAIRSQPSKIALVRIEVCNSTS